MSASFSSENLRDGGNPCRLEKRSLPTRVVQGGQVFVLALLAPRKGIRENGLRSGESSKFSGGASRNRKTALGEIH